MSKFQPPMLNNDVCRAVTDKQIHKHTHKKTTYILSKNRGNLFFTAKFCNSLKVKKRWFPSGAKILTGSLRGSAKVTKNSESTFPGMVGCQTISNLMEEKGPISPVTSGPTRIPSREP